MQEWANNGVVSLHDHVPEDGWIAPFHPVLKPAPSKDNPPTIRWTSDFRSLNSHTKPLLVVLPNIEDNLLLLSGSRIFSSLDLSQAYFHIRVYQNSLKYLYQACPNFFLRYECMPFGLKIVELSLLYGYALFMKSCPLGCVNMWYVIWMISLCILQLFLSIFKFLQNYLLFWRPLGVS